MTGFLDLPLVVRQKIYVLAGLVRSCPINVDQEHKRWPILCKGYENDVTYYYGALLLFGHGISRSTVKTWQRRRCAYEMSREEFQELPGAGCIHDDLPLQILWVSKQICLEAVSILYSQNQIILESKFSLPRVALKFLTSLEVRLTRCSCMKIHVCNGLVIAQRSRSLRFEFCDYSCRYGCDEFSDPNIDNDRCIVIRWKTFCENLREHLAHRSTKEFRLVLICDCGDLYTAERIVRPLNGFPILQHATIRLGRLPDESLRQLAKTTVRCLTSKVKSPLALRSFSRLPIEIQELILTKSDLVALTPLSWREDANHPQRANLRVPAVGFGLSWGLRLYHNILQSCCRQCTISGEVCACPTRHAASTSYSCKCWDFPSSLFLVNRFINEMATRIFCSRNEFVLWDSTRRAENGYLRNARSFIKYMPWPWATQIRWLRLAFGTFDISDCDIGSKRRKAWSKLTAIIKNSLLLEQLSIDIDYRHDLIVPTSFAGTPDDPAALSTYREIVNLFQPTKPRHYKNFFVRLGRNPGSLKEDWKRWNLECELERLIMGEAYDSTAAGKYADRTRWNESLGPKAWLVYNGEADWDHEGLFVP